MMHRFTHGDRKVLALHGFTGSGADWRVYGRLLEADLLAPDLPGHGDAPPPDPEGGAEGFLAIADQVVQEARAQGWNGCDGVGYSMGGRIALAIATRHPGLFRTLTVIGASAGIADEEARRARRAQDEAWARTLERDGLAAFIASWDAQPMFAGRRARPALPPHDARALAAALRAVSPAVQPPLEEALSQVARPVLIVVGARDVKYVHDAPRLAARLARAEVAIIPDAGHAVTFEAARPTAERIRAFWRDHP